MVVDHPSLIPISIVVCEHTLTHTLNPERFIQSEQIVKAYIHGQPIKSFVQLLSKLEMMQDLLIFFHSHLKKQKIFTALKQKIIFHRFYDITRSYHLIAIQAFPFPQPLLVTF